MSSDIPTARLTTGEMYTGNQSFQGLGVVKWCAICGTHKEQGGGHIKHVMGGRHWVCKKHPKVVKK